MKEDLIVGSIHSLGQLIVHLQYNLSGKIPPPPTYMLADLAVVLKLLILTSHIKNVFLFILKSKKINRRAKITIDK